MTTENNTCPMTDNNTCQTEDEMDLEKMTIEEITK